MKILKFSRRGGASIFFSSHNILSDRDLEKCLVTLNSVAKTTKRLPNSARIDAIDRGNMDELFVNVDEVVNIMMSLWFEAKKIEHNTILHHFHTSDINGDGKLDFMEFQEIVNFLIPNLERRSVLKLFRQGGYENVNGEIELAPENFAAILKPFLATHKRRV